MPKIVDIPVRVDSYDGEKKLKTYQDTVAHIQLVQKLLMSLQIELMKRAATHDQSKLEPPEFDMFVEHTEKLASSTYGSPEYMQNLETMKTQGLAHHYAHNRHHPEHYPDGLEGMNLIDVLEMFADWIAAVERHDDGDIYKSIEHNKKRFGISDQLAIILVNTVPWVKNVFESVSYQSDISPTKTI